MYKQEAMVLIRFNESIHRYQVTTEAATMLSSITTPIAIISVAGLYRTGKSYLLNRMLLNRSNGFGVGPTINPCTKGLWIWGQPIRSQSENGEPLTLLIIDTEGLGALDEDQTHDCKIFSLAILLSTCFVYNSIGSIDENAIQSLNMVLNLTDHISKISRGDQSTPKSQMPNFVWVVRDFSLQLIDDKGTHITQKEYLENALAQQKGSSKQTEEKNKIRRFIAESFGMRECFTLVKPLIHEEKLQALDKVPFEELRPEFIEQVIALRKRVMGKLKPKLMKGVALTGESYLTTIKCYVEAINNGAVPNIQNAWDYMCSEQNAKRTQESYQLFETFLRQTVPSKIPCLESQLRQLLAVGRQQSFTYLRSKLLGDSQQCIEELRVQLESKIQSILANNQRESSSTSLNLITKEYQQINKKLKSNFYTKFAQFQNQLRSLCGFMLERNRRFAGCQLIYLQFINKRLTEGSQFFAKMFEQQIELLKTTKSETQCKYDKEISDLKTDILREKAHLTQAINMLEREKVEMTIHNEQAAKHLRDITQQNGQMELHFKSKFDHLNKQLDAVSRQLRQKEQLLQQKQLEAERNGFVRNGEWQKEKALFEQEKKFLKDKLEEAQRKQKQLQHMTTQTKTDWQVRFKDFQQKQQSKIKILTVQLNEKTDKLNELTDNNNFLREEIKSMEEFAEKKEKKLRQDLQTLERALEGSKNNDTLEKNRLMVESINEKKHLLLNLDEEREKVRTLEIQLKEQTDQVKLSKANIEKDKAIYTQKIQFQEIELAELRSKFADLQNRYHETVNNFESSSKERLDEAQRALVFDLKTAHEQQMKELLMDQEMQQRQLKTELDQTKRRKQERELQIQLDSKRMQERQKQLRESLRKVEDMCERLQREKLNSQKGSEQIKKDLQCHFEIKIRKLEKEIQQTKEISKNEVSDMEAKTESTIRELKHYFEIERERLEKKVQQEKDRGEKKGKRQVEQVQQRFSEERIQLEQDNHMLRENLSELQSASNQKIANMQFEFNVSIQKFNNQILEKKIQFNKQIAVLQQQLDYSGKRIEEIIKERERDTIRHDEKIKIAKEQAQNEARQSIARMTEEKATIEQKNEKLKRTLKDTENALHKLNIDYQREKTTLTERLAGMESRISEYEQRARTEKKMLEDQIQKLSENHKIERSGLLKEIEKCKDSNLRMEQQKQQLITRYENQKVLILNKAKFLQDQRKRAKDDYEDMLSKFETTVKHLSKQREILQSQRNQSANQVALALKSQYERQTESLRTNHNKIVRDLQDKVSRVQIQKKSLNDKVLSLELRASSMSSQTNNNDIEKKLNQEMERLRHDYENKMNEYQKILDAERSDHKKAIDKLQGRIREAERHDRDNPYQNDRDRWNGAERPAIKDTTNLGSTGKVLQHLQQMISRESETKKSRLATLTNGTGTLGSATSLLSNIGQGLPKKTTKELGLSDINEFGGIIQFDKSRQYKY